MWFSISFRRKIAPKIRTLLWIIKFITEGYVNVKEEKREKGGGGERVGQYSTFFHENYIIQIIWKLINESTIPLWIHDNRTFPQPPSPACPPLALSQQIFYYLKIKLNTRQCHVSKCFVNYLSRRS